MAAAAPRISPRLRKALDRMDDGGPVAELARRVGAVADELGLARPSYEQVRVIVHELRRARARPTTAGVLVDIATRTAPPTALVEHLSNYPVDGP
jgi:hypothetical protein